MNVFMHLYGYYGNLFLDLYSEEPAVPYSHNGQTYHVSNSRPTDSSSICHPHIPIKAPQVSIDPFMCCTMAWLLSLLQFVASQSYSFSGRKSTNLVNTGTVRLQDNSLQEMKDEGVMAIQNPHICSTILLYIIPQHITVCLTVL